MSGEVEVGPSRTHVSGFSPAGRPERGPEVRFPDDIVGVAGGLIGFGGFVAIRRGRIEKSVIEVMKERVGTASETRAGRVTD